MSTPTKAIKELAEKIWLNATSHGHGEPIASQAKAILAIVADMEREGEPVAWMYEGGDSIHPAYLTLDKDIAEDEAKDPSSIIALCRCHPSPTTADAKDSTVDVQEVIKVGDAMANRLKLMETGAGLQAVWNEMTKPFRP